MTKYAMVKFEETEKEYYYICNIKGLNENDEVLVTTKNNGIKKALFKRYVPSEFVSPKPQFAKITEKVNVPVKNATKPNLKIGRTGNIQRRTKKQIVHETSIFDSILSIFPNGLSSEECGKLMNANGYEWKPQSYTSNIRTMQRYSKVIRNPHRDLYIHKNFLEVTKIG